MQWRRWQGTLVSVSFSSSPQRRLFPSIFLYVPKYKRGEEGQGSSVFLPLPAPEEVKTETPMLM